MKRARVFRNDGKGIEPQEPSDKLIGVDATLIEEVEVHRFAMTKAQREPGASGEIGGGRGCRGFEAQ